MSIVILGMMPWQEAAADAHDRLGVHRAHLQRSRARAHRAALVMTALILFVAAASLYAMMLGYSRIPFAAARDGDFFRVFARVHPTKHFPHVSLLAIGRGVDPVLLLHPRPARELADSGADPAAVRLAVRGGRSCCGGTGKDIPQPFTMWLYPLPALLSLALWLYIFFTGPWEGASSRSASCSWPGPAYASVLRPPGRRRRRLAGRLAQRQQVRQQPIRAGHAVRQLAVERVGEVGVVALAVARRAAIRPAAAAGPDPRSRSSACRPCPTR